MTSPLVDSTDRPALPPAVNLLDVLIHPVSAADLIRHVVHWGNEPGQRRVYYANVHAMNLCDRDPRFRASVNSADLVFCDGYGVKWAAGLPYRLTPPDWIDAFATATAEAGQSVFAIGDVDGVSARFQRLLTERHPGYRNAGNHHGFFGKSGDSNARVIDMINRSGATHLLVGFGMPLQEFWIDANAARLRPRVLMPVGALFRWYTGTERRAPPLLSRNGLEWLYRLGRHPVRHFDRYVIGNPAFFGRVIWHGIRTRLSRAL